MRWGIENTNYWFNWAIIPVTVSLVLVSSIIRLFSFMKNKKMFWFFWIFYIIGDLSSFLEIQIKILLIFVCLVINLFEQFSEILCLYFMLLQSIQFTEGYYKIYCIERMRPYDDLGKFFENIKNWHFLFIDHPAGLVESVNMFPFVFPQTEWQFHLNQTMLLRHTLMFG